MGEALHSEYSASGFEAARLCPGSTVLSKGLARSASKYSAEGTVAHGLLEVELRGDCAAPGLGEVLEQDGFTIVVDDEMVDCVQRTAATMREMAGPDPIYFAPEQRVNYAEWLGVDEGKAWGTLDFACIPAVVPELQVHDFKYGKGVAVDPDCDQLKLYALGVLDQARLFADIDRVRLVIHQPRIKAAPSEHVMTVAELEKWAMTVARQSAISRQSAAQNYRPNDKPWEDAFLRPGDKQCRFCPAKGSCPKAREKVLAMVWGSAPATPAEFEDLTAAPLPARPGVDPLDWLGALLPHLNFVEEWAKTVRADALRHALAGEKVPGQKVVRGRMGNRAWKDKAAAEAAMKAMRLTKDQMYDLELISPTSAAKLAPVYDKKTGEPKPGDYVIGDRQWKKLQAHITRGEGALHLAPESDDRPAVDIKPVVEMFEDVAAPAAAELDLSALI